MFWLIDSCQNSVSADQYHLTVSPAQVSTHWVRVFFLEVIRWQVATLQMIAGSSSISLKCICTKSCSWTALLKFWFQTDLGRENSTVFYMQGRQSLLTFLTIVTDRDLSSCILESLVDHALRPIFMLWLVKIWQVGSCGKFMQRLETCLLIAEADRVLCHLVMFLTVFFYLMYQMK